MERGGSEDDPRDAADALAAVPLFGALTPVDRAKLASALEERWVPAGDVVFEAGEEGDALYVLRAGLAERRVAGTAIETVAPPEVFGELALLTDEPRSASIVALTPLRLWVLPRAQFHPLLESEPDLLLRLSAAIGRRLAETRAALGELQRVLDAWVGDRLDELAPRERELLERTAVLDPIDPALLAELSAADAGELAAELSRVAERSPLLVREDATGVRMPPAIRAALLRRLERDTGLGRLAAWRRQAAGALEARGHLAGAIALYLEAGATPEARRLFATAPRSTQQQLLRGRRVPADWGGAAGAAAPGRDATPARAGPRRPRAPWRGLGVLVALGLALTLWWIPPATLGIGPWRVLVVVIAGAVLLAVDALPDGVVVLLMILGWVVPGLVEPSLALAGFASESWLLVLSVLAIGVAVGGTGLLYRAALVVLARAPEGFGWRALLLAGVGTLVTPALPNATSRMALAAPLARELAEALGYRPGSRAAAGLALAVLIGFGQMSALFLTGSSVGLLVHGLLPPEARGRFGFGGWLLAALPAHAVLFALAMAVVVAWYRPEQDDRPAARLALQRAVLGPMGRAERLALGVLLALVVGFLTEPLHGVGAAWVGVGALGLLVAGGVLNPTMLRTGVNWSFLLFFGGITSLGGIVRALAIDRWLAETVAARAGLAEAGPVGFCLGLALAGFALSFVVRWQAAAPLLTLVAMPLATPLGVDPFLVALVSLVATHAWFVPFQSTVYLALYHGSGELFSHARVRPVALAWGLLVLLSLVAAVPAWRWMGLLP